MATLRDYSLKWISAGLGRYKYVYILMFEGVDCKDDKEIASIIKTKKTKILVEAKCDMIGLKVGQEFDEPKLANKFVTNTKKRIRVEILKAKEKENTSEKN